MYTKRVTLFIMFIVAGFSLQAQDKRNAFYITNQKPLVAQPYTALPLGTIKPKGWLLHMLELQRNGLTGHLDSLYKVVCGSNSGWLGGTGDSWERGPYWIDGLVPLAYILDDQNLKEKAQKWIEWSITNQRTNGYFGPFPIDKNTPRIRGTQQTMSEDWWPKMVMLKALQQYYTATQDKRVLILMDKYFRYQLAQLPANPLGKWTYWAEQRGGDNLQVVYWLYNITKEKYLLQLAELIHKQTFNWTEIYTNNTLRKLNPYPDLHCVNVAQGLKEPVIYYQQHPEPKYTQAVKEGLAALHDCHGFVNGMYGGDEAMHGNDPTQGSELCSAVEMMYSFESILPITGDRYYGDYLEKVAFNVLPTQHDDAFTCKQYYQQVNQTDISYDVRNFDQDGYGRVVYGTVTGYPCCISNMHQGWPKYVQNLWYATADNGLAALVYGASQVKAKVRTGIEVEFAETTQYPFSEKIEFTYLTNQSVSFPLHLRIPGWCNNPQIKVNGTAVPYAKQPIVIINRTWSKHDKVELVFPMNVRFSRWHENSVGIEHGPLVYALRMEENWKAVTKKPSDNLWNDTFYEVTSPSRWNFGLSEKHLKEEAITLTRTDTVAHMPWNLKHSPVQMKVKGRIIPSWMSYNHSSGKIPYPSHANRHPETPMEEIILIPYGCTTLRIAQFPVVDTQNQ